MLDHTMRRLQQLATVDPDSDDDPITAATADTALNLMSALPDTVRAPRMRGTADGSLILEWADQNRHASIKIDRRQHIHVTVDGRTETWPTVTAATRQLPAALGH